MRRLLAPLLLSSLLPLVAWAQPPEEDLDEAAPEGDEAAPEGDEAAPEGDEAAPEGDEAAPEGDEAAPEGDEAGAGGPRLRPPEIEPIDIPEDAGAGEALADDSQVAEAQDDLPSPADAAATLEESTPPEVAEGGGWTSPGTALTLHGYFRVRTEMWDTFYLGRADRADPPFSRFRPIESALRAGDVPSGGCGSTGMDGSTEACDSSSLGFANMRLRLEPTIALSDDVRVHMQIDVFDNVVLGSTPDGLVAVPGTTGFERVERTPRVPLDSFTATLVPPSTYRNSLTDSVVVRRAWAEVTNRGLGQLRFGRMPSHWGLGILANGGDGIDSDYQSDVDRIMAVTKIAGLYWVAAYDFASQGFVQNNLLDPLALPYDATQSDDVDEYVFAVARRMDEEDQQEALQHGDLVLNGGMYLVYRKQLLSSQGVSDIFGPNPLPNRLVRRGAEAIIPDLWVQLMHKSLRVEFEAVLIAGSIDNVDNDPLASYVPEAYNILQFGAALEADYSLLDDKLGLHFYSGLATGDEDIEGLTVQQGLQPQLPGPDGRTDRTISTYRFHPNYRVDLILWRNIMQQIAGAYYFKPGVSYDFIHNSFGQLFGLRADLIYSRAMAPVQTWGNSSDLGVELDGSLYYRSEDGPELFDGFYAQLQYGILFPLKGLGYLEENGRTNAPTGNPDLSNAQIVRLIMGVQY